VRIAMKEHPSVNSKPRVPLAAVVFLSYMTAATWAHAADTQPSAEAGAQAPAAPASAANAKAGDQQAIPVPTPAAEPSRPNAELATVIVTAAKRKETQQEVAGSVGVVLGKDLQKMGAQDMEAYLKLVPGVSLNKGDQGEDAPTIRGIATSAFQENVQATTGIYIDDIPFTDAFLSAGVVDFNPYDLQRVEVLKGPQGTLYGSSSLAGAIRYVLNKPELDRWEAQLGFSGTRLAHNGSVAWMQAGEVNIPVGKTNAIRLVGLAQKYPGYIDDNSPGRGLENVNSAHQAQGRVAWLWKPASQLGFEATYIRQESRQADTGFADQRQRLERSDTPTASPSNTAFNLANLVGRYDFGWASLSSSSSFIGKELHTDNDIVRALKSTLGATLGQDLRGHETIHSKEHGFGQEVRLTSTEDDAASWKWLVGAWYLRSGLDYDQVVPLPTLDTGSGLPPVDLATLTGPLYGLPLVGPILASGLPPQDLNLNTAISDSVGKEYAVFGNLSYKFWHHLELTVGGRLFRTTLDNTDNVNGILLIQSIGAPSGSVNYSLKSSGFNPKVSLRYEFDRYNSVYALVSKGFQFGGVQLLPPPKNDPTIPGTYQSSTLWNYELGAKTEWFKHKLGIDAAVFEERWKNLQLEELTDGGLFPYNTNVGRAHTDGAELSLRTHPIWPLTFSTGVAYMRAVTDVPFNSVYGVVPKGARLPTVPRFQISSVVSYDQPFDGWLAGAALTHTFTGHSFNDLWGTTQLGDYATLDGRIHLRRLDERFEPDLSLGVNNILNAKGVAGAVSAPTVTYQDIYFIRPRAVVLSLSMNFD
jgi:outer membrane receptor protein involved in Fe transport